MSAKRPIGTPRTTRLRKLECECGNIAYQSRARLSAGLLTCCCGREMIPAAMEDAALVLPPEQLAQHPEFVRYEAKVASVVHGQGHKGGLHAANHRNWTPAEEQALELVEHERREHAQAIRLNALAQHAAGAVAGSATPSDPIPF